MLSDWIRQETVIVDRGRRFVCRPPTARTVALVLGENIELFRRVAQGWAESGDEWTDEATQRLVAAVFSDPHSTAALDTCVTLWGAAPGELAELLVGDERLRLQLAMVCLSMLDLDRALAENQSLLTPPRGDEKDSGNPDAGLLNIAALARVHPLDVLDLPYGLYLSLRDIADSSDGDQEPPADNRAMSLYDIARHVG